MGTRSPSTSRQARAVTPMAFVQAVVLAYARRGRDPGAALHSAQIAPASLRNDKLRITAAQMERLCDAAMRELDDEALGWFARRLPWGSYGMLARASLSAPDLGVALKRWCRHHRLIADELTLTLTVDAGLASVAVDEHADLGALREFCLVSMLRNLLGVGSWLIDSRIELRRSEFPFAAPRHAEVYPLLFPGGPVGFDAARARLEFDAAYLALPVRRDERAMNTMLDHALPLTVRPYRRDRLLVQRVRELLRARPQALHNAAELAAALNLSTRTLHRQLHDEGATLQALKDEVRRSIAIELLARTQRPIKQIAAAAGFANEKSFARAFRLWTGQAPSALRRGGPIR